MKEELTDDGETWLQRISYLELRTELQMQTIFCGY